MLSNLVFKPLLVSVFLLSFVLHADTNKEWEGQYVGFSLGYNKTEADFNTEIQSTTYFTNDTAQMNPILSKDLDENNLSGTIMWGINKQNQNLVYGLEADLSFSNYDKKSDTGNVIYASSPANTFRAQNEIKSNWLISLRPRIGYATKKSLFFISAGPALTYIDYTFRFEDTFSSLREKYHKKSWKLGIGASVGYEHILNNDWRIKMEYSYYTFNNIIDKKHQLKNDVNDGFNHNMDLKTNSFRIGFVKKF